VSIQFYKNSPLFDLIFFQNSVILNGVLAPQLVAHSVQDTAA